MRRRRTAAASTDAEDDSTELTLTDTTPPSPTAEPAPKKPRRKTSKKRQEPSLLGKDDRAAGKALPGAGQGRLDFGGDSEFSVPPAKLLTAPKKAASGLSRRALDVTAAELENVLNDFSVKGAITQSRYGPVVTRYDLEPAPGTRSQRVISLADDIARSMSAVSVRVASVPGQNVIGVELPNADRQIVALREILDDSAWQANDSDLPMALGKDIAGAPIVVDLARMPHLLVAGTTGSGKSVGINAMILSLLYRHTPESCRMIMICLLYTSPSPRDKRQSRMPSSA